MITRGYEKGLIVTRGYGYDIIKAKRIFTAQKETLIFNAKRKV